MPYTHGKSVLKIGYADSDITIQDFVPGYIDSLDKCKVIFQAYSGKQIYDCLRQNRSINLLIMDYLFPDEEGVVIAEKIKTHSPDLKILFNTHYTNEVVHFRAIKAGVNGLIRKNGGKPELKTGINEVMKTGHYFPHRAPVVNKHKLNGHASKQNNHFNLTEREILFLSYISTELTYQTIGMEMKISERLSEHTRNSLFEKFGVHSRAELAIIALNSGLRMNHSHAELEIQ